MDMHDYENNFHEIVHFLRSTVSGTKNPDKLVREMVIKYSDEISEILCCDTHHTDKKRFYCLYDFINDRVKEGFTFDGRVLEKGKIIISVKALESIFMSDIDMGKMVANELIRLYS